MMVGVVVRDQAHVLGRRRGRVAPATPHVRAHTRTRRLHPASALGGLAGVERGDGATARRRRRIFRAFASVWCLCGVRRDGTRASEA